MVGAGPNGLTAAAFLARAGLSVHVIEARDTIGGGARTSELTLPGFLHDECSAVHTFGCVSPAFSELEVERHGLEWVHPTSSVAHPLDAEEAVMLELAVEDTAAGLGVDGAEYQRMLAPFMGNADAMFRAALGPLLRWPQHPMLMARFGALGLRSAEGLAGRFRTRRAKALLAGCAAHSVLPLDRAMTGGMALLFFLAGHTRPWPVVRGGSVGITRALSHALQIAGGTIQTRMRIRDFAELPSANAYVFDTAPAQLAQIAAAQLPHRFVRRLERFRMGPAVFKVDWALDGPIPWTSQACGRAATVHVGGSFDEIAASERAVWDGQCSERPFLIVCQQSLFDRERAPAGKHTGYAYCHVPAGCTIDQTARIERQIERFAPGFGDRVLARRATNPAALEAHNPSNIGGAITGGVSDLRQMLARPSLRFDPYSTPNPKIFLCSHSTPPGGGVHGMCGDHAARSVLSKCFANHSSRAASVKRSALVASASLRETKP